MGSYFRKAAGTQPLLDTDYVRLEDLSLLASSVLLMTRFHSAGAVWGLHGT